MAEFNPYEAPRADITPIGRLEPGGSLWQDGEILVARSGAEFPDRCIKCDAPADGYRFKRTVRWHPQGYYLLLFLNVLIYLLVAAIVTKKGRIEAGLCWEHRARRRNAILVGWLLALLGVGVLVAGAAGVDQGLGWLIAAGGLLILIGAVYGIMRSQVLVPQRIEKEFVRLQKVDRGFLAPLPRWAP